MSKTPKGVILITTIFFLQVPLLIEKTGDKPSSLRSSRFQRENDGIMERWNDGILGPFAFHLVEKNYGFWDKQTMDRKNINRGFKKLRVWQDAEVMRF